MPHQRPGHIAGLCKGCLLYTSPADSEAEETALEDAFEEGAILPDAGEEDEVLSITLDN